MANVHDVATYILAKKGEMTTMRLQKLCYYSLAWHAVWDEDELFPEVFQAWANGPVCYALFNIHRGSFTVSKWPRGEVVALEEAETESIDCVLKYYGDLTGQQLSQMTHSEAPWLDARRGLAPGERGDSEIKLDAMARYYEGL